MSYTASLFTILISTQLALVFSATWTYDSSSNGPTNWYNAYPNCAGSKQSPINIVTSSVTESNLGAITFTGYGTAPGAMTLENNGHTVQVNPTAGSMSVSGSGLSGTCTIAQFHFHWGSVSTQGSEHTVDSKKYPMEMHIVHYDTSHADLGTAANVTNGLAVLGFFFEVSSSNNAALDPITTQLTNIIYSGNTSSITPFAMNTILPSDLTRFYRYSGSLTTPTCFESVQWTVFDSTIKISEAQLDLFRAVKFTDGTPQVDNYRPIQSLNSRTVTATFKPNSGSRTKPAGLLFTLLSATLSVFKKCC